MKKKYKCFVCKKEIDEEEAWSFKGHTVHRGECLKKLCDEDNAVRKLQQIKDKLQNDYQEAVDKINDLQQRIDKAIEYVKSYLPNYDFDHSNLEKVLEILGEEINTNNNAEDREDLETQLARWEDFKD